jgi:hypothetical protein
VRRNGQLPVAEADVRERNDYGRGTETAVTGERREDESRTAGMDDGIPESIYTADTDAESLRLQGIGDPKIYRGGVLPEQHSRTSGMHSAWDNWPDEPELDRVVDGIPNRVDRIKCLGNAVVPQQFYPFFKAIAEVESEEPMYT